MNRIRTALCALGLLCSPVAFAGSINFEVGAPCNFIAATSLTSFYSGQGVTFSGPGAGSGGAILDQCGHFGVNAHSGTDFLAFNPNASLSAGGSASGPETITFSSLVSNISLFVGGTNTGPSYTLLAFDAGSNQIGSASGQPAGNQWVQLSINSPNISFLTLSVTSNTAVVDDLSWNGSVTSVPEPSTARTPALGLLAIAATFAFRRREC
jgi:hypothetical protein